MPSIGNINFLGWAGRMLPAESRYRLNARRGLPNYGIAFDTDMGSVSTIITRAYIPSASIDQWVETYRAMVGSTVVVVDPTNARWSNVVVLQVNNIAWDLVIGANTNQLLTATWTLLPEVA